MTYATWNMQGISDKMKEVSEQLEKYHIDFVALTETKKKGNSYEDLGEYIVFFSDVPKANRAQAGVAIAIQNIFGIKIMKNNHLF